MAEGGHKEKMEGSNSQIGLSDKSSSESAYSSRPDVDTQMAKAMARKLKIPFVDPLRTDIEPAAVALLDPDMAVSRQALPIRLINDTLAVAMAAPDQPVVIKSLELLAGLKIRPMAAPRNAVSAALKKVYGQDAGHGLRKGQKNVAVKKKVATQEGKKAAFTVSVISNKGGVGKTHFSINLAYALAKGGAKVLLIDADLGNADISNKLGIFPEHHLMDFLEKDHQMQDLIVPTKYHFDLICSTYGEFKLANLYYAQKVKFIKHFRKLSHEYEFVVFDLGAGISLTVLDFALAADRTVIVTTPQDLISGYACAKASFARFKEVEEKLAEKFSKYTPQWTFSPMLLMNQVRDLKQGVELFDTIVKTAGNNINAHEGQFCLKPEYLGAIPYDKESLRATEQKRLPLLLNLPYIKASQCMQHISERFLNPDNQYDPGVKFRHPLKRFAAVITQKI